jgi:DNA repair protein RAD50
VKAPGENLGKLECPCCKRSMDAGVAETFDSTMKRMAENSELFISDPAAQEKYQKSKAIYQNVRTIFEKEIDKLQDFRRLTGEAAVLEKELKRCSGEVLQLQTLLKEKSEAKDEVQKEYDELRSLCEITRRWVDDANRISQKKIDIKQKQSDLRVSVVDSSRDFRTVERSIAELKEEKETLTNKIFRLNKEMTNLNTATANKSAQVAQHEKLVREKEERYAAELKASERKKELQSRIQEIGEEERKLVDQIAPLQARLKKKEVEKQKLRALRMEEEQKIIKTLSLFDGDVQALRNLEMQIKIYTESNQADESTKISAAVEEILGRMEALKQGMKNLEPQLDSIRKAVNDQERHKKQLKENIDILVTEEKMKAVEKEKKKLEEKLETLEGFKDAQSEYNKAKSDKEHFQNNKSICEGRFSSLVEQIRAMKRKLSSEEYKNVDERHRVAMIKHVTTKTAAEDLKKYGNALDKVSFSFPCSHIASAFAHFLIVYILRHFFNFMVSRFVKSIKSSGTFG